MRILVSIALAASLTACGPVTAGFAVGGVIGLYDITAANGCIGVEMSNWFPWNEKHGCDPVAVPSGDADPIRKRATQTSEGV